MNECGTLTTRIWSNRYDSFDLDANEVDTRAAYDRHSLRTSRQEHRCLAQPREGVAVKLKVSQISLWPAVAVAMSFFSLPAKAELKVGTQVHWAPDEQTGVAYVDTVVATGPDFVISATPDPTGEWDTSYGVEFSGLDAIICDNSDILHSGEERNQLAAMWPPKVGDVFFRHSHRFGTPYSITVVRKESLEIEGVEEDVFVLTIQPTTEDGDTDEDFYVYVSERLKTNVKVDWNALSESPNLVPITDTVEKIVETAVETIEPRDGYQILATLDYEKLGDCAALLPEK